MAFELISTTTVGSSGAASIDFTSIPQTYKDLMVVYSTRCNAGSTDGVSVRINSDSTSGRYTSRILRGNGSSATSFVGGDTTRTYIGEMPSNAETSNTFLNGSLYIPNYASSNQKSMSVDAVGENNSTTAYQVLTAGLYNQTTAITSVSILANTSSFVQYSQASLYGVSTTGATGATVS